MSYELVKVDSQGRISIPKDYMNRLGIKSSDLMAITIKGSYLVVGKVEVKLPWEIGDSTKSTAQVPRERGESLPQPFKGITEEQTNMILDLCRQLDISPPENLDLMSMEEAAKLISDLDHKVHHKITDKQKRYLIYLYKKLGLEYDEDEINSYTTEEASKKIDELRAKLG